MPCKLCETEPVISRRYSGEILCKRCFYRSFEKNADKELRNQINQLVSNSEIGIKKIGIGLSGGKDSTVALHILKKYSDSRGIEIIGLCVDEGIEGYRSESLEYANNHGSELGVEMRVSSYKELIGMTLGELLQKNPPSASPCSPCGILRRRSLNNMAKDAGVDCMVLGHNLDDFSQTVLMNHSRGDVPRLVRMAPHRYVQSGFIPRLVPLRRLPEQEAVSYTHLTLPTKA